MRESDVGFKGQHGAKSLQKAVMVPINDICKILKRAKNTKSYSIKKFAEMAWFLNEPEMHQKIVQKTRKTKGTDEELCLLTNENE